MKLRTLLLSLTLAASALAADGFKPIFNGKDLSGWEGNTQLWSVRDGAITGQTKDQKDLTKNTFLIWKGGETANFELRLKFKLTGENEKKQANSGVQYRSKVIDQAIFSVGGYQADIDGGKYIGMLYEEQGRGILMQPGQQIRLSPGTEKDKKGRTKPKIDTVATPTSAADLAAAYKFGEWNELRIVAKGNHVQHFVNGKITADVTDDDTANAPKSGVLALQLHVGPPMTIQFKDVQLKTLP